MTDTTTKLSDTARIVLARAAEHPERLVSFHKKLPAGARHKVAESLLKQSLLEETAGAYRDAPITEHDGGMLLTTLRITDAGFRAIGAEPPKDAPTAPHAASPDTVAQEAAAVADALDAAPTAAWTPIRRSTLPDAARAVLDAWDSRPSGAFVFPEFADTMEPTINALRAALGDVLGARHARAELAAAKRGPRQGTKQETVLAMLRRADGASGPQIAEATGWNSNTVRGFLAGLKKKGFTIETLERVRMVGPNKDGARGSYSVYKIGG